MRTPTTPRTSRSTRLITLSLATAALTAGIALPASASGGGGGGVESFGACSGDIQTTWVLDAEASNGQVKIQAQVFVHFTRQTFVWKLTDNAKKVAKGTSTTDQEHQDTLFFRIRKTTADQPGSDVIGFTATRQSDGEVCSGTVTV